jgi:hypothetical protein
MAGSHGLQAPEISMKDITRTAIIRLDTWLDANVSPEYVAQPLAQDWARVAKIQEECGEAIDALIGMTGQNPRKGFYGNQADLLDELCDVIITGYLAIQHFTKNIDDTETCLNGRWNYRLKKAGL